MIFPFLGKYSAVAFIAAGKLPASPNARTARLTMKPATETLKAVIPKSPSIVLNRFANRNC